MADDIVIRLSGQDDISPILAAIADNLDTLATKMAGITAASTDVGDTIAASMDAAALALGATADIAGVSKDALTQLGMAFKAIGADADQAAYQVLASSLDFQGAMNTLTLATGDVASAFGLTSEALSSLTDRFPTFAQQVADAQSVLGAAGRVGDQFAVAMDDIGISVDAQAAAIQKAITAYVDLDTSTMTAAQATAAEEAAVKGVSDALNVAWFALQDQQAALAKLAAGNAAAIASNKDLSAAFTNMEMSIRDSILGIDDLSSAMARAQASGYIDAATMRDLADVTGDMLSVSADKAAANFAIMATSISKGVDQAIIKADDLLMAFEDVSQAVGNDTAKIEIWRAAMAKGSLDLQELQRMSSGLADAMAVLRVQISQTSDANVNLSSAAGDALIRMAAVDAEAAAAYNINQDLAKSYVKVSEQVVFLADAMAKVQQVFKLTGQNAAATVAPIQDMGAAFEESAMKVAYAADAEMVKLTELMTRIDGAAAAFGDGNVEFNIFAQALNGGSVVLKDADAALASLRDQMLQLEARMSAAAKVGLDFTSAQTKMAVESAATSTVMADQLGITEAMAAEWMAARNNVGALATMIDALRATLKGLSFDEQAAAANAAALAAATNDARIRASATNYQQLGSVLTADEVAAGGFRGVLADTVSGMANQAMNILMVATAFGSVGAAAVRSGVQFQSQMAVIQSLSANAQDLANNGIAKITQQLIADAPAWGQTPTALAQGLYFVESAGFHTSDAMNILKYAAYGASGGLGSMKDVSSAVTTLLDTYGQKGTQAANVTGLLIDATIAGKTTIEDLSKNLGKIAATSSTAGYTFLDTATALDVMTRSGLGMAQATTYLRATEQNLGLKSASVAETAKKLGINIDGATLTMMAQHDKGNALVQQLGYIGEATKKAAAEQRLHGYAAMSFYNDAMMKMTGGIRSGTGAIILANGNFAQFQKTLAETQGRMANGDASAAIQDHFNQIKQTIGFAIMQLKGSFAAFGAQFVITFGPQIYALIERFTSVITKATQWMAQNANHAGAIFKTLGGIFAAFAGGSLVASALQLWHVAERLRGTEHAGMKLGKIFGEFDGIAQKLGSNFLMIGSSGSGLASMFTHLFVHSTNLGRILGMLSAGGLKNFAKAIHDPGKVLDVLAGKLQFLGNINLVNLFHLLDQGRAHFLRLGHFISDLASKGLQNLLHPMGMIRAGISGLWTIISGGLPALGALAGSFAAVALPVLLIAGAIAIAVIAFINFRPQVMQIVSLLRANFLPVFHAVVGMVMLGVQQIKSEWATMAPKILPAIHQLMGAIMQLGPAFQVIGGIIKFVVALIIGVIIGLVNGFLTALPMITRVFTGIVQVIAGVGKLIMAIIHGQWGQILPIIGGIFTGLRNIIVGALGAVVMFVAGALQGIIGWFNKLTGGALGGVTTFITNVVKWFQHLFDVLVGHSIIPDLVNAVIKWMLSLPAKILGAIAAFVVSIVAHFIQMENLVTAAVIVLINATVANFHRLGAAVLAAVNSLTGGVVGKILSMVGSVVSTVAGLPGRAVSAMSGLASGLAGVANNAMNSMVSAISGAAGRLANAAKNVVSGIINGAKHVLGINSPSKVFMEIGDGTAEGMAMGIANGAGRINDAAKRAFGAQNMPVGHLLSPVAAGSMNAPVVGVNTGAVPLGYRPGAGGSGTPGAMTVTVNVTGGLGDGLRMMSPTDRRRLAFQIGQEMALATGLQGISPLGYSGRGTI